jgi:hypothetical protein
MDEISGDCCCNVMLLFGLKKTKANVINIDRNTTKSDKIILAALTPDRYPQDTCQA